MTAASERESGEGERGGRGGMRDRRRKRQTVRHTKVY